MKNPPKVLIVEDELIIALDMLGRLTNSGVTVTGTAGTAAEAFEQIERDSPDIVLMDIRIKGDMDGVAAAGVIRNRYGLPVIFLTAHADDATLERAQRTEPFGYVVKPLGNTNIKAMITMAVYKQQMERERRNSRKLLSTILHGLSDAVLVADVSGELLFVNRAAEELTGWSQEDAVGRSLAEIAPIEDSIGRLVTDDLLQDAIRQNTPIEIGPESVLITRDRGTIDIDGKFSVTAVGNRAAGVFITLRDVTTQRREDHQLRQEQRMFVAGELAMGVAREFYELFDLIDDSTSGLSNAALEPIKKASQLGKNMSTHLMDLREAHGSTHAMNVHRYLLGALPLLKKVCGDEIDIEVSATEDAGYVVSTGNHLEQVLLHLVLDAKKQVDGCGLISITADRYVQPLSSSRVGQYVRLAVRAEKSIAANSIADDSIESSFGTKSPDLGLTLVRAIAIASEGSTRVSEISDSTSLVEVFLPRYESRVGATAATDEYPEVILLVGLPVELAESVRRGAGRNVLFLEAENLDEAVLISEVYSADLDLVVLNDSNVPAATRNRAWERIHARRPNTALLQVASPDSAAGLLSPGELERRVEQLLRGRAIPAVA